MVKISVIIPVYNVEQYLAQCLDSIINQSIKDIEIICIDDGSTDNSDELLNSYAAKDKRIVVIHKENSGYGASLNIGLKRASGEYIGIVESDDMISTDMYETLYMEATKYDVDFVKADAYYWYEGIGYLKRIHENRLDEYYDKVLGENERNIFFDFFMNIWTGIYKRDFLLKNRIYFNESPGASYQDNGFWMQTCIYAEKAMWLNRAFYYYRQDNPEASVKNTSKIMAMTREYEYLEKILKSNNMEVMLPYCFSWRLYRLKGTYFRIEDKYKLNFVEQIRNDYEIYKAYIKWNQYTDNWIRSLLKAPEKYTDNLVNKKLEIRKSIIASNGIIIYGIGKYGDIALRTLYNEGLYDEIRCFAISDTPKDNMMASKKIYSIEEACRKYQGSVILLAVIKDSMAYQCMTTKLEQLGIYNVMDIADLLDNFYVL